MTNQLKTEIEKINQQLDEFENPKMTDYNKEYYEKKFGKDAEKEFLKVVKKHPVESYAKYNELQSKKQGLIQGAKMMIKNEIKFLENFITIATKDRQNAINKYGSISILVLLRINTLTELNIRLSELKQLNNWLEKE